MEKGASLPTGAFIIESGEPVRIAGKSLSPMPSCRETGEHAAKGGAETLPFENDYGMINGIINNGPEREG